jgi:hypothetical protein
MTPFLSLQAPISYRMIAMLRYIKSHPLPLGKLRIVNQLTLWALLHRSPQLVKREGDFVVITNAGIEVLAGYTNPALAVRKVEADLSQRVESLIALVRSRARRKSQ